MATLMVFILLRLIPGDPALVKLVGETGEAKFTQAQLDAMRAKLGTDRPLYVQYGAWVWGMLRLDFGVSMFFEEAVSRDLAAKFPITLELTVLALLIATIIAVPLGLLSAIKQDTPADYVARIITIAGVALPNFWVGILIVYFLVLLFGWMPPLGYANVWEEPATNLQQLIFPALPLGTVSGYEFGRLLAGTVVIENIFMVPGMGKLLIDSVLHRDYTTVQAVVVVTTVSVLILNRALR